MTRNLVLFAFACLTMLGCNKSHNLSPAPETIFDEPGMHVVTSTFNQRTETISVLYGNDAALSHAGQARPEHVAGEEFKLVTWGLKPNPLWFGSDINGPLRSVETVKIVADAYGAARIDYGVENRNEETAKIAPTDSDERINFIFAQRASVFP
jgi:hypothetical protein|uniref:hypothetical protein n=1 Tax=Dyadobacter sp. MSC1_007 TaxID=2909264 RepID=UPI00202F203C|nr:hypothetical protein [Dyadobacter sp. MSC1_007]